MTENSRLAIAAPAIKERMMTLRSPLVLLEVAMPEGFWVCTAVIMALQSGELMPFKMELLELSRVRGQLELSLWRGCVYGDELWDGLATSLAATMCG